MHLIPTKNTPKITDFLKKKLQPWILTSLFQEKAAEINCGVVCLLHLKAEHTFSHVIQKI